MWSYNVLVMKSSSGRWYASFGLVVFLLGACSGRCGSGERPDLTKYAWPQNFEKTPDGRDHGAPCTAESATVTVLSGSSESAVLAALGIDPASRTDATFHEAEATWTDQDQPVQIWTSYDGRTVVVEPNGFQGSLPATLEAMAHGADATSVYWSVAAGNQIVVVEGGSTVRRFDPLLGPKDGDGASLREEKGLPFGGTRGGGNGEKAMAASLAFLERRTGYLATADAILTGRKPTYRRHAK